MQENNSWRDAKMEWSTRKLELDRQLYFLREKCISENDYSKLQNIFDEVEGNTDLLDEEDLGNAEDIKKTLEESTLTVKTLPELRYVLEQLKIPNEAVEDTLAHENAHGNVTQKLGARHLGYKLLFMKNGEGKLSFIPQASLYIPEEDEGWSKEKQSIVNYQVIRAPADYGNELSQSDIEKLKGI